MTTLQQAIESLAEFDRTPNELPHKATAAYDCVNALRTLIAEYERLTARTCERCRWNAGFGAREPIGGHDPSCPISAVMAEARTAPPTDDERDALWELIDAERRGWTRIGSGDSMALTDAILASDVWRNRRQGPPTDDEREALERILSDLPDPSGRVEAILASDVWRNRRLHFDPLAKVHEYTVHVDRAYFERLQKIERRQEPITDEAVRKIRDALAIWTHRKSNGKRTPVQAGDLMVREIRAVLESVERGRAQVGQLPTEQEREALEARRARKGVDPDCRNGKHAACPGWTWVSTDGDDFTQADCTCPCHTEEKKL